MTAEFPVAVHAIVYLWHRKCQLSSEELAKNICTNPARVRKVMARLKRTGLVLSREGRFGGGYYVNDDAGDTTLARIYDALGEEAVSVPWRSGDPCEKCLVAAGMADAMQEVYDAMNRSCRERLETVTVAQLERRLVEMDRARAGGR